MKSTKIYSRPLSPHLSVYSSQLTSLFSIWHRITGVGLIICTFIFILFLKVLNYKIFFTIDIFFLEVPLWLKNTLFLLIILFLNYHSVNGVRHIIWDLGYNLPIVTVERSAKIIVLVIFVVSINVTYNILN